MGERLLCKQEVVGSIPSTSTNLGEGGEGSRIFDAGESRCCELIC